MKLVAEKGYGGASASLIAKDAKVATGYFYLHYSGKYELVNSLLSEFYNNIVEKLNELINHGSTFNDLIDSLIHYFFQLANEEPIKAKFFYVISSEYNFRMDDATRKSMFSFISKIMKLGQKENLIDSKITEMDMFLFTVINTIQYINQQFKHTKELVGFTETDVDHYKYLMHKVLNN